MPGHDIRDSGPSQEGNTMNPTRSTESDPEPGIPGPGEERSAVPARPPHRYTVELADRIETQWQGRWERERTFQAPNPGGPWADPEAVARYRNGHLLVLDMFPYPSGAGLHVGHPLGYIATDVYARFHRMLGLNVLHCLGYDAFGLPAEQYAVQTGQHPRITTQENIAVMRRQLRRLGLGHDDRRSVSTIDPGYYRWTQWIFLQIWNAWYDADAIRPDGGRGRARPIDDLIAQFASGDRILPTPYEGRGWDSLTAAERAEVLNGYRLAYTSQAPVNWAPGLGTVLSNEEVTNDGRSERGNFPVFKTDLRQWMMRITAYADRLADDLDLVDWPEQVKTMQRNWIGRSRGARIRFDVADRPTGTPSIEVFSTRPDTIFGAGFLVLAPEHPLVETVVMPSWPDGVSESWTGGAATPAEAVAAYRLRTSRKSDVDRQGSGKIKSGVFTGGYVINPVTEERLPVFIADYVLMGYGTGAVMGVPGEDERDWDFAEAYGLPRRRTVQPPDDHDPDRPWTGPGTTINSANDRVDLNGLSVDAAVTAIIDHLQERGSGEEAISYRLRDWLFSRQRYWGEPFPIVFDRDGVAHAVPEDQLPVELPEVPDYAPRTFDPDDATATPEPPLGRARDWIEVELDLGDGRQRYRRETNTMPNWAGSCWYYLRYLDPANNQTPVDPVNEAYWLGPRAASPDSTGSGRDPGGVDLYIGGVEHAVLHLLYARFWHKVLHDLGHLTSDEPFRRYFSQGYIQAPAYRDHRGQPVPAAEVVETRGEDGTASYTWQTEPVTREFGKIGKSLKNVISPDEMYASYGADTFRVYEMSLGPLEASKPWETRAVIGSQRFLQRLWRNVIDEETGEPAVVDAGLDAATARIMHRTIDAVRRDYAALSYNTAIARLIEFNNALTGLEQVPRVAAESLVLMVSPLAPHLAEELWRRLGHANSLSHEDFPVADPDLLVDESVTCVIQINGKVRDRIEVAVDVTESELETAVRARPKVRAATPNGIRRLIIRAPKLVNVVPGDESPEPS